QKMEAIGRLAGGIAHDFNNLLTVIEAYSEFAQFDHEPDDPRSQDIAEVRRAAGSAAQLTRQLLAFGRKQVLSPKIIGLNDAIRGMLSMLERLIGEHIRLVSTLRADLPNVRADPVQLQQILMNLTLNARDA